MIKLPVKDPNTIPWMTQREIPAIKAALSAWRKLRRDNKELAEANKDFASTLPTDSITAHAEIVANYVADMLMQLAAIDERLRKEAKL